MNVGLEDLEYEKSIKTFDKVGVWRFFDFGVQKNAKRMYLTMTA